MRATAMRRLHPDLPWFTLGADRLGAGMTPHDLPSGRRNGTDRNHI
jgi:hypothetical protein